MIEVTRKRQTVMHEHFLVRGIGKRAIHVVIPFDYNKAVPVSELLSEYELYWLICQCAEYVHKNYNWKRFIIRTFYLSDGVKGSTVSVINCSGFEKSIGRIDTFIEIDHFTNDNYLCPKYFYIPKYRDKK